MDFACILECEVDIIDHHVLYVYGILCTTIMYIVVKYQPRDV